jgi:hypothetical protein
MSESGEVARLGCSDAASAGGKRRVSRLRPPKGGQARDAKRRYRDALRFAETVAAPVSKQRARFDRGDALKARRYNPLFERSIVSR